MLVVDDGSRRAPPLDEALPCEGARVIRQRAAGPAAARTTGASAAVGEILLFTDSDCLPDPYWVVNYVAAFEEDPTIDLATGPVIDRTTPRWANPLHRFFYRVNAPDAQAQYFMYSGRRMLGFIGANFAIRTSCFKTLRGFETSYRAPGGEDFDLAFRAQCADHRAAFVDTAVVGHSYPSDPWRLVRRWVTYGMGKQRFAEAHGVSPSELDLLDPSSLSDWMRLPVAFRATTTRHFEQAFKPGRVPPSAYAVELFFQIGAAVERRRAGR